MQKEAFSQRLGRAFLSSQVRLVVFFLLTWLGVAGLVIFLLLEGHSIASSIERLMIAASNRICAARKPIERMRPPAGSLFMGTALLERPAFATGAGRLHLPL